MRNSGVSPKNKRKGFSRSRSSCAVRSETCGTRSSTNRSAASPKGTRAKSRPALEFLEFLEFRDSHRFTETPGVPGSSGSSMAVTALPRILERPSVPQPVLCRPPKCQSQKMKIKFSP